MPAEKYANDGLRAVAAKGSGGRGYFHLALTPFTGPFGGKFRSGSLFF